MSWGIAMSMILPSPVWIWSTQTCLQVAFVRGVLTFPFYVKGKVFLLKCRIGGPDEIAILWL